MNDPQIISLLSVIPFVEIQTFMEQQIRKLIMNSIRETYFNTLSMNATLPNDLIGHILSFHPYHAPNINQTSKMWNKCALIGSGAKVIFNKCVFKHGETGIWCPEGVCLDTKRCTFTKCDCAIYVVPGPVESNVNVVGCLFDSCSSPVRLGSDDSAKKIKLLGIGKIFRNNLSHPFGEKLRFENDCNTYSL
eukprot:1059198_1